MGFKVKICLTLIQLISLAGNISSAAVQSNTLSENFLPLAPSASSVFEKTSALSTEDIQSLLQNFSWQGTKISDLSAQLEVKEFRGMTLVSAKKEFCGIQASPAGCNEALNLLVRAKRRALENRNAYPVEMFGPHNEILAILQLKYGIELATLRKDTALDSATLQIEKATLEALFFKGPRRPFDAVDKDRGYYLMPQISISDRSFGTNQQIALAIDSKSQNVQLFYRKHLAKGRHAWHNPASAVQEEIRVGHQAYLSLETATTRQMNKSLHRVRN